MKMFKTLVAIIGGIVLLIIGNQLTQKNMFPSGIYELLNYMMTFTTGLACGLVMTRKKQSKKITVVKNTPTNIPNKTAPSINKEM